MAVFMDAAKASVAAMTAASRFAIDGLMQAASTDLLGLEREAFSPSLPLFMIPGFMDCAEELVEVDEDDIVEDEELEELSTDVETDVSSANAGSEAENERTVAKPTAASLFINKGKGKEITTLILRTSEESLSD
jgi:hypothetical protein